MKSWCESQPLKGCLCVPSGLDSTRGAMKSTCERTASQSRTRAKSEDVHYSTDRQIKYDDYRYGISMPCHQPRSEIRFGSHTRRLEAVATPFPATISGPDSLSMACGRLTQGGIMGINNSMADGYGWSHSIAPRSPTYMYRVIHVSTM